jgi:hypothetical protein
LLKRGRFCPHFNLNTPIPLDFLTDFSYVRRQFKALQK